MKTLNLTLLRMIQLVELEKAEKKKQVGLPATKLPLRTTGTPVTYPKVDLWQETYW